MYGEETVILGVEPNTADMHLTSNKNYTAKYYASGKRIMVILKMAQF